jgi:two-component system sensor histidine kinase/response regulator
MTTILIVEDDPSLRESLVEMLKVVGEYNVVAAHNGRTGVEVARKHLPDLIVCDIHMPELDGFGVLAELQKHPTTATIPFIFVSARADRMSTRHGMTLGADDYISKPFGPAELLAAVRTRLAKQEALTSQYEEKLESLRDNILSALPHELRTPLTGIIGFGEVLARDAEKVSPEHIKHIANSIIKSGRRLHRIIENYLVYAQIELIMSDPQRVKRMQAVREAKPDKIVRRVVKTKQEAYGRAIHPSLKADTAVLPILSDNLQKIIEELVDNACKFSPPESVVEISTAVDTAVTKPRFTLTITNEGRGMSAEQIRDVGVYMQFERKMYEQQGSGMGLIIAKRLVELHRGQLLIESVPKQKTNVIVTLPL